MDFRGMTALVTGASSGLGEEFAKQLAARGCNLVLVARFEDKLNGVAQALRQETGSLQVAVIIADFRSSEAVQRVITELDRQNIKIDLLVNNAGLGIFEDFMGTPLASQTEQVDVNIRALVQLTHGLTPGMTVARRGGVINLASSAAFQPLAGAAVYAASKAFVLFFSEGLAFELAQKGIHVLAACPGPVATPFFANMNPRLRPNQMDQPAAIVGQILRAFARGKRVVVPGKISVRLGTLGARLMPRNLLIRLAARTVQQLNRRAT